MRLGSPVVLSYLDAGFEPRCGLKDFLTACCCLLLLLLLLKRVAHPWPLKGGVKPRQGKPSSVNIPLKWEPHGRVTTWGEASIIVHQHSGVFKHHFSLQRKGVIQQISDVTQGIHTAEREQWVYAHSPNARSVLRTLFPALLYKSVLYALYLWHRPEDIRRYPWYMNRDIAAVISRVICHGYLRISRVNSPKTQN